MSVVIIGYGNPLRSDDGLAWHAAKVLEEKFAGSDVEILCLHQLAPEVAQTASLFKCVIFVDAALPGDGNGGEPGKIRVSDLCERNAQSGKPVYSFHALSPHTVVEMAAQFYGVRLKAFAVTMTGENFELGESLSSSIAAALPNLILKVESMARAVLVPD